MRSTIALICPDHRQLLMSEPAGDEISENTVALNCPSGCRFPVIGGIPHFVPKENYAAAFGHQWKVFRRNQLDSYMGTDITRIRRGQPQELRAGCRLFRLLGGHR